MKSVKPADFERQTRLDPAVRFALLTGPDEATMSAVAQHLIGLAGKDAERLDLTGAQLSQDPSLLAAEAASMLRSWKTTSSVSLGARSCTRFSASQRASRVRPSISISGGGSGYSSGSLPKTSRAFFSNSAMRWAVSLNCL